MAYGTRGRKGRQHAGAGATDGNRGGGVISKYAAIALGGFKKKKNERKHLRIIIAKVLLLAVRV